MWTTVTKVSGAEPSTDSWGVKPFLLGKPWENGDLYGKIHHAINGKIHYFDWVMFNSYFDITRG